MLKKIIIIISMVVALLSACYLFTIGVVAGQPILPTAPKHIVFNLETFDSSNGEAEELANILRSAGVLDTVTIYITSYGGEIIMLNKLLNAIEESKAKVITVSDGASYSAGSILSLAGDEIVINKNTSFVFHLAATALFYKRFIVPLDDPTQQTVIEQIDRYAGHLLTDAECEAILEGRDVLIPGYVIKQRLKEHRENKHYLIKRTIELIKQQQPK